MKTKLLKMEKKHIDECAEIYINTFSKKPWYDDLKSKDKVTAYFKNFINSDLFLGFVCIYNNKIVALSAGIKKPWIEGFEYYIDEFCVDYALQGHGIGTEFIGEIEKAIIKMGMNGIILNTDETYPAFDFYIKNGFVKIDNIAVLTK